MDFDFLESEIVFTDLDQRMTDRSSDEDKHSYCGFCDTVAVPIHGNSWARGKSKKKKAKKKSMTNSQPVDIPETFTRAPEPDSAFEERDNKGEVMPPHLIVRRRTATRMVSSVCFSHGRTLKGRYLNEVRNSILRMTGFLES